jgi:hypothetical protein
MTFDCNTSIPVPFHGDLQWPLDYILIPDSVPSTDLLRYTILASYRYMDDSSDHAPLLTTYHNAPRNISPVCMTITTSALHNQPNSPRHLRDLLEQPHGRILTLTKPLLATTVKTTPPT